MKEFVEQLVPDKLTPFAQHPFQLREDAAMDELTESIVKMLEDRYRKKQRSQER